MITLFSVRPRGFNIGNDAIFLGLRLLLREAFGEAVNIVQIPSMRGDALGGMAGLTARTVHLMNLFGHGVIVGGGNLYENGSLDVDLQALAALRPPLMLYSLSHGRIYDHAHRLVARTDAMPDATVRALHARATLSVARDEATMAYLQALGVSGAVLGGCPSTLLARLPELRAMPTPRRAGTLLSVRHPQLTSMPVRDEARLHAVVPGLIRALEADGLGPVRLLCHDVRDLTFAASLGEYEYLVPDDAHAYLDYLRAASLVVSFRLHAFVPSVSFGTPAVNISYDERSSSLVRTLGFEAWDVDFVRSRDVVADARARWNRLADFERIRREAQPRWAALEDVLAQAMRDFAGAARRYAADAAPA